MKPPENVRFEHDAFRERGVSDNTGDLGEVITYAQFPRESATVLADLLSERFVALSRERASAQKPGIRVGALK